MPRLEKPANAGFFIGSAGFRVKVRLKINKVKPTTNNDYLCSNNHLPICGRNETDSIGIVQHASGLVRHLTYGDQRRLEVARATEPLLLAMGEPAGGKTSTLKAITGPHKPTAGHIYYNNNEITTLPPCHLVPEGRGVFARLTVEENIAMGAYIRVDHAQIAADQDRVYALFLRLAERRRQMAGTLSGEERTSSTHQSPSTAGLSWRMTRQTR